MTISSLHQISVEEQAEELKQSRQAKCVHRFIFIPTFDFEHDRIIDIRVCENCDLET